MYNEQMHHDQNSPSSSEFALHQMLLAGMIEMLKIMTSPSFSSSSASSGASAQSLSRSSSSMFTSNTKASETLPIDMNRASIVHAYEAASWAVSSPFILFFLLCFLFLV
jgi:hypothetical protein